MSAVVIVGAGPVGLAAALRLAGLGIPCTVLEANPDLVKKRSKALCIQHSVLRILDLMGCAGDLVAEGTPWSISRTFERRFYFDAQSNPGRQIVGHAQPGNLWRIDWQLPPDIDVDDEQRPGRLDQRIRALIGQAPYELDWVMPAWR